MDNLQTNLENLVENGFFLIKDALDTSLLNQVKSSVEEKLIKLHAIKDKNFLEKYRQVLQHNALHPYQLNALLMREIVSVGLPALILKTPVILNHLINIIGPDLAYETTSELAINFKNETNDSLVKKFHQEIWTGSSYRTFSFWAPIYLSEGAGTLEIVKGSHHWGHIPHQNREPKWIPEDAEIVTIKCNEGDVLIFSSLTLHRTELNRVDSPRVAYVTTIRNIFDNQPSFEMMKNWEIFHLSPAAKILKKCGNPHLSPFRTYNSSREAIS